MKLNQEQKQELKRKAVDAWKGGETNKTAIAKDLWEYYNLDANLETVRSLVRKAISNYLVDNEDGAFATKTETKTNQYEGPITMSAIKDGKVMTPKEYCQHYGLDFTDIRSYKLVTHTGTPYYNIASQSFDSDDEGLMTEVEMKEIISKGLETFSYSKNTTAPKDVNKRTVDVVKMADLHFGAYIDGLIKTKDYSINILAERLLEAAQTINDSGADEVHIHLLGDLIESFTGLNHKNSWKGLQKGMIGAEAVKLCTQVLHESFLQKINNLASVKIIAGNHDRVTSDNKEDTDGGAADLIAWGLQLIGYDVEFNPFVITHVVDGICHILMHGDKPISKKPTKDICFDYGQQGVFNLLCEGHLHSTIEKLSVKQRLTGAMQTVKDDSVDHKRIICPSIFTGNSFSEYLGYTSQPGFLITRNNGKGVPHVLHYAL